MCACKPKFYQKNGKVELFFIIICTHVCVCLDDRSSSILYHKVLSRVSEGVLSNNVFYWLFFHLYCQYQLLYSILFYSILFYPILSNTLEGQRGPTSSQLFFCLLLLFPLTVHCSRRGQNHSHFLSWPGSGVSMIICSDGCLDLSVVAQGAKHWLADLAVLSSRPARSEIFSTVNGVLLQPAFRYQHLIVLICVKYCWKGRNIASHTSIYPGSFCEPPRW